MELTERQNNLLNELVQYIDNWRLKNKIFKEGSLDDEELKNFVKDVQTEIKNKVSMDGKSGQTLLLYTGKSVETGNWIWQEMERVCKSNSEYYYISSTDGGSILWEQKFQDAVKKAIINKNVLDEDKAIRVLSGKMWNEKTGKYDIRINQYAIEGTDILALDDFISKTLTEQAVANGNRVIYVAGQGWNSNSVGMQTEIPSFITEAWIGKDIDEALKSRLTIVSDLSEITDINSQDISDVALYKTEFYTDADGKVTGVKLISELDDINVGILGADDIRITYGSKLGILTDEELWMKYNFLSEDDLVIDKFRLYEYQKTKSTTELTDTKVYFDSEGKAIGLSCYDDVPSETALELRLSDTENYLSDTNMSYKYMDYDTYSEIDKLKACQYDYERTQISDMIDNNLSSQNDIELMSYEDLKAKYTFIDDTTDADVIKELQIAEYRDKKYGTTTTDDIKLYYDENGKMSCISDQGYESIEDVEIKANAKFSADVTEVNQYRNAEYMTTICPEYDNLTPLQKLQLQQLELDARNHDMSKLHDFVANDTAGNLKNVRITYDADGVVSGIDTSEINGGSALDVSKSNTTIDIASDGKIKISLDKPSTGKAWWQDELVSIINNDSVTTINEMTKRKNKGSNIGNIMEKVA